MPREDLLYNEFNARYIPEEEIARKFVRNDHFPKLIRNEHSLLLGPRGSGKTTLLKMLTLPALAAWRSDNAKWGGRKPHLDFVAVYIPSDTVWSDELKEQSNRLAHHVEVAGIVSKALITTSILDALCATMANRRRFEFVGPRYQSHETELCKYLINQWQLPPTIPCLESISLALSQRYTIINSTVSRYMRAVDKNLHLESWPPFFDMDYLAEVIFAVRVFDKRFCSTKKWALCFDELEIAPQWLQKNLMQNLRSTDQSILYKLSTSPIPFFMNETNAQENDDFRVIRLWEGDKRSARKQRPREFSDRLSRSILERHFGCAVDPRDVFGTSVFASDKGSYSALSEEWRVFCELAEIDDSFRRVMLEKGVSFPDYDTYDQTKRDQILRKAKPVAMIRHFFKKMGKDGRLMGRSRKSRAIYSGVEAIYDLCDGNPRWLVGLINDLLSVIPPGAFTVDQTRQAAAITGASIKFWTKIEAIPGSLAELDSGDKVTLADLLERVGCHFRSKLVGDVFTLDPPSTFWVDECIPEEYHRLLRIAADNGAIVEVDPQRHSLDADLLNRRFRLSFMLAPYFSLPFRLYRAVALTSCIDPALTARAKAVSSHVKFRGSN